MQEFDVSTLELLKQKVIELTANFSAKQIVLLEGPLGSGKTQTVRYIVESLNGGEICSPSFAIHNIYKTERGEVDHVDLYRLDSTDDIESTGFWDIFEKDEGLILIEWADYLDSDQIPIYWNSLKLKLTVEDTGARKLNIINLR